MKNLLSLMLTLMLLGACNMSPEMPTEEVVEEVVEEVMEYTITFHSQGGTEVDPITLTVVSTIEEPEPPTMYDNTFEGWYMSIALEDLWDFENYVVDRDVNLYAKWAKQIYSITYVDSFIIKHNNPSSFTSDTPTIVLENGIRNPELPRHFMPHHIPVGWEDMEGNIVTEIPTGTTENVRLKAIYDMKEYTFKYSISDPTLGNIPSEEVLIVEGDSYIEVASGDFILNGLPTGEESAAFDRWLVIKGEDNNQHTPYSVFPGDMLKITGDLTLVPYWRPFNILERGPAGGIIVYDKGSFDSESWESSSWRYLEIWEEEEYDEYGEASFKWEEYIIRHTNIRNHPEIGGGFVNTYENPTVDFDLPRFEALAHIRSVTHAGYEDWFLPSVEEMELVRDVYYEEGIFGYDSFWTSTSTSQSHANVVHMYLTGTNTNNKSSEYGLLAMRRF